ncbi:hypothetical protein CA265_11325 [Sphingobacteriaceae bacterium GW460-11-11-14-LB5]|nr:hypothetical protein CA265_11325 [Sphingobacteriaceae bacterium GW460-11-11-14-LB5]
MNKRSPAFLNQKAIATLFALLFFAYSCRKDNTGPLSGPVSDNSLRFTSSVEGETGTKATGNTWQVNDSIGLFMKKAADAAVIAANKKYITTGDGNFSAQGDHGLNYPDGSAVNFVAYYPYQPGISGNIYPVDLSSQTSLPAIDLMYANNATGFSNKSTTSPNLSFTRQLVQVDLTIMAGSNIDLNGITASFQNMNTRANFDLNTGTLTAGSTLANVNANIKSIAGTPYLMASVILLPLADAAGKKVIFTLASGSTYTWTLPSGATFEKGKKYRYNVTLGNGQPWLQPFTRRVFPERDSAQFANIVDKQWVVIGNNNPYAFQKDYGILFNGEPSYRFELKSDGTTRDRVELQYAYATNQDYAGISAADYIKDQKTFSTYLRGKGITPQASKWRYQYAIYVPSTTDPASSAIFSQIHGMNDRTLVVSPNGEQTMLTKDQFLELTQTMIFDDGLGYSIVNGAKGPANGWKMDAGGYPPMEMGFGRGQFYISVTSDSKWATDIEDRNGANIDRVGVLQPVTSAGGYKIATNVYRMPFANYPKDTWVTFVMDIDYSAYNGPGNQMIAPGKIDVTMSYHQNGTAVSTKIVNNATVAIGRNDAPGYYFKFGIYQPGDVQSFVVNCAGYSQTPR